MLLSFKTKTDINGNTYTLELDTNTKEINYNKLARPESVTVTRKQLRELEETAKADGYTVHLYL